MHPNCKDGTNIDYIVDYNGLSGRDELYRTVTGTQWWNAFTGFFPGLPFMFPIDPRMEITVPKYNPTRTWTAEGAVGIGGPCVAIYPVESPGGYQLFGRTLPILDMQGRNKAFAEDPLLIRPGDRVEFTVVDEAELDELRRAVFEDRYDYQITDEPFVVRDYLANITGLADEAAKARTRRARSSRQNGSAVMTETASANIEPPIHQHRHPGQHHHRDHRPGHPDHRAGPARPNRAAGQGFLPRRPRRPLRVAGGQQLRRQ